MSEVVGIGTVGGGRSCESGSRYWDSWQGVPVSDCRYRDWLGAALLD